MTVPVGSARPSVERLVRAMHGFWGQVLATGLARTFGLLVSAVSLVVAARFLGPARHGELAATINWMNLLATLGSLSLGQVALHAITGQRREEWLGPTMATLLVLTGIIAAALGLGLAIGFAVGGPAWFGPVSPGLFALGACLLPLLIWDSYATPVVTAANRLQTYNVLQVTGRVLTLGLLIAGLAAGGRQAAVLAAIIGGNAWIVAGSIRDLGRIAAGPLRPSLPLARRLLAGGLRLHWNAVATFFIMPIGVLVTNAVRGPAETGYYQLALQLFGALTVIPTSAAVVLYGHVARDGADGAWPVQRRVLVGMVALMTVAAILSAAIAPWMVTTLAGEAFAPSATVFRVMLLAMTGVTIASVMAPQWIGRGLFVQASALTVVLGFANFAATIWLVGRMGMLGAAWALVGTYVLFAAANLAMAIHCQRRSTSTLSSRPETVAQDLAR